MNGRNDPTRFKRTPDEGIIGKCKKLIAFHVLHVLKE